MDKSLWLNYMYNVLYNLKFLLSDDGCIFIHINSNEQAHLKIICDEIFNIKNFITTFSIKVRHEKRILKGDRKIHDVIEYVHMYQKSNKFNIQKLEKENISNSLNEYVYNIIELTEGTDLLLGNKHVKIFKENEFKIIKSEPNEYGLKKINIRGTLKESNSSGRFYVANIENRINNDGYNVLYKIPNIGDDYLNYRYFLSPENNKFKNGNYFQGIPLTKNVNKIPYPSYFDFSNEYNIVNNEGGIKFRNSKKPEILIKKFFEICGVKNNDIVLDCFLGSGTTAAVAHKMNLNYIGIEIGDHIYSHCVNRLKNIIDGKDLTGITNLVKWNNGGGFKFYEIK